MTLSEPARHSRHAPIFFCSPRFYPVVPAVSASTRHRPLRPHGSAPGHLPPRPRRPNAGTSRRPPPRLAVRRRILAVRRRILAVRRRILALTRRCILAGPAATTSRRPRRAPPSARRSQLNKSRKSHRVRPTS